MRMEVCIGGSGGQGVLLVGAVIIHAASLEGKSALCLPSYGAEARGGEVSCFVILSDSEIKSPFIEKVDYLVFFNSASFTKFHQHIRPGVTLLYDASQIELPDVAEGAKLIGVPLGELVAKLDRRSANMAMLGVFIELTHILDFSLMEASLMNAFKGKSGSFITLNLQAIEAGRQWAKEQRF
jgi:Pyruvate/2-oxoacid:ferredoxin oxidoreductase gamma subunit